MIKDYAGIIIKREIHFMFVSKGSLCIAISQIIGEFNVLSQ